MCTAEGEWKVQERNNVPISRNCHIKGSESEQSIPSEADNDGPPTVFDLTVCFPRDGNKFIRRQ